MIRVQQIEVHGKLQRQEMPKSMKLHPHLQGELWVLGGLLRVLLALTVVDGWLHDRWRVPHLRVTIGCILVVGVALWRAES